ncbi:hypothetical protein OIO90_002466 [Microbotryomycetes sp. JL221]|nr:hypothetical protein OIO90_002466 [Microbotryomycetes sp. JL221]
MAMPMLEERATSLKGSAVTWKIPTGRPFDDSLDSVGPCGGAAQAAREDFPLSGGRMSVLVRADADNLEINYSSEQNPTKNGQFKMAVHEFQNTTFRGHHCLAAPDFASLGLKVGDQITLQTVWRAGVKDTILYSCADVTLVDPSNYVSTAPCIEGALDVATADTEDYSDAAAAAASGLTTAQKAGIGAGVGIAGLLLIGGVGFFLYKRGKNAGAKTAANTYSGYSIDGRTLGDAASFNSRDMAQKTAA